MNQSNWTQNILGIVRGLKRGSHAAVPAGFEPENQPGVIVVRAQICLVLEADFYVPSQPISFEAAKAVARVLNERIAQQPLGAGVAEFSRPYHGQEPMVTALYFVNSTQWATFCDTAPLAAIGTNRYAYGDDAHDWNWH